MLAGVAQQRTATCSLACGKIEVFLRFASSHAGTLFRLLLTVVVLSELRLAIARAPDARGYAGRYFDRTSLALLTNDDKIALYGR
jgi:hypothetical protein